MRGIYRAPSQKLGSAFSLKTFFAPHGHSTGHAGLSGAVEKKLTPPNGEG